jgi:tetratricopeptide (TPR) repeat protein
MSYRYCRHAGAFAFALLLGSCSSDPRSTAARHVARGDEYAKHGQDREAIVEYRIGIQQDPRLGQARLRLAEAYVRVDDAPNAFKEYIRAADLLPDSDEAQLKAGTMLLVAGRFDEARERAEQVLARRPDHIEAQLLRAYALAGLKDFDAAVEDVQEALALGPDREGIYVNLGQLELARGDSGKAEAAFRRAVEAAPTAALPLLALGDFFWRTRRMDDAEAALKHAVGLEPKNVRAARALGFFYLTVARPREAEEWLKRAAELAGDLGSRLILADFYAATGRAADARPVLESLAGERSAFAVATTRLAALSAAAGDRADAKRRVDAVLASNPRYVAALVIDAQLAMTDNRLDEALARAETAAAAGPRSVAARFLLGTLHVRRRNADLAIRSFNEVLTLEPRHVGARTELSRLYLMAGNHDLAVQMAEGVVTSRPDVIEARLLLVRALMGRGDRQRAALELGRITGDDAQRPEVLTLQGTLAILSGRYEAGRRAFEAALAREPGNVQALAALLQLDFRARRPDKGVARADAAVARAPADPRVLVTAAGAYRAAGDVVRAEAALRRAIEVDGESLPAYEALGRLYASQKKLVDARRQFDELVRRQPRSVGAHTMLAMIAELSGDVAAAQRGYEQALQVDRHAGVAANNLAWLYAEHGGNLDVALQLAQTAVARMPDQPEARDTLGWIYHRKGLSDLAIRTLRDAAQQQPRNPVILSHLGLAYARAGQSEAAKPLLEQALAIDAAFAGHDAARQALAQVPAGRASAR